MTHRLQTLLLARLATSAQALPQKRLHQLLLPLVSSRFSPGEWRESLQRSLLEAQETKWVGPGEVRGHWVLLPGGRTELARRLGQASLPRRPSWKALTRLMVAQGLGGIDPRCIDSAEALRVTLIAREQGLELSGKPTKARLSHALVWKRLGVKTDQPLSQRALEQHLFAPMLGEGTVVPPGAVLPLLAARAAGARRSAPSANMRENPSRPSITVGAMRF